MLQQKQVHTHTHTITLQSAHALPGSRYSFHLWFPLRRWWVGNMKAIQWTEERPILSLPSLSFCLTVSHSISLHFSSFHGCFSDRLNLFQWFSHSRPLSTSLITSTPYLRLSPVHLFLLFMFYLFASFSHNSYLSLSLSFFPRFPPPLPFGIRRIVDVATWEWWGRRSGGLNTEWSAECLETHIYTITSQLPLSPQSILRNKNILFRFLPLSHTPTHSDTHKMPISYQERLRQHLTRPALPFVLFLPPFPPLINLPCSLSENFIKELQLRLARLAVAIATTLLILWSGQVGEREGGRKSKKAMRGSLDLPVVAD